MAGYFPRPVVSPAHISKISSLPVTDVSSLSASGPKKSYPIFQHGCVCAKCSSVMFAGMGGTLPPSQLPPCSSLSPFFSSSWPRLATWKFHPLSLSPSKVQSQDNKQPSTLLSSHTSQTIRKSCIILLQDLKAHCFQAE